VEPNGFTHPDPQPVGALGAEGILVDASLDPTSPDGLDPGDRDGFAFTLADPGPLTATVDDGGAGKTFLLGLIREEAAGGVTFLGGVLGPAPLSLGNPGLEAGPVYRVGVASFGDGTPLPYSLSLETRDSLVPWTGQTCDGYLPEAEPDDAPIQAVDLGWFDRTLCGEGEISSIGLPEEGIAGDADVFRFRNVLPIPARIVVNAGPGEVHLEVQSLAFIGAATFLDRRFGGVADEVTGTLQPGADYFVRLSADRGDGPIHYTFHVEASAPAPPAPPEPLDLRRAVLRLSPGSGGPSFSVRATFQPGLGSNVQPRSAFSYRVRGLAESFEAGARLFEESDGRLRYRAFPGTPGLRTLTFDPFRGLLVLRGRGLPLDQAWDPGDPTLEVRATLGEVRLAADETGEFRERGRVLRTR
jgi:hypothetical protein